MPMLTQPEPLQSLNAAARLTGATSLASRAVVRRQAAVVAQARAAAETLGVELATLEIRAAVISLRCAPAPAAYVGTVLPPGRGAGQQGRSPAASLAARAWKVVRHASAALDGSRLA